MDALKAYNSTRTQKRQKPKVESVAEILQRIETTIFWRKKNSSFFDLR
jgi:hypothetical protein